MDDVGLNGGERTLVVADGRVHRVGTSTEPLFVVEDRWRVVGPDEENGVWASDLWKEVFLGVVDGPRFGGAGTVETFGAEFLG